jgi:zinc protease
MPLPANGLTRLSTTSKLFFAASQQAFSPGCRSHLMILMKVSRCMESAVLRLSWLAFMVALIAANSYGQSLPEPTREQLLNRLTVLFWQRSGEPNVLLKLRVHSGAAFDLAGKGGTMALLGDIFFPDPITREYVTQELGGQLEVVTDLDAIDVTLSGKASEFERMVELLRTALVTTQLTPDNVTRARDGKIKQLTNNPGSAAEIADRAIAARLFGHYPYGHPASGSPESVAKVDRSDVMLARERFLNADNATLVVIGGIERSRAMRALRQLLGQWRKGDRIVPATFQPPDAPDARVLVVNQNGAKNAHIRLAVRGLARSDRDYAAAMLLARVMQLRLHAALPEASLLFVRHEAHALPGSYVIGASAPAAAASRIISVARDVMNSLVGSPPSTVELEAARDEAVAEINRQASQTESIADAWLDIESYRLPRFDQQANALRSVIAADVQRVAVRLFKGAGMASVVVGNSEELKASLGASIQLSEEAPRKSLPVFVTPASKP